MSNTLILWGCTASPSVSSGCQKCAIRHVCATLEINGSSGETVLLHWCCRLTHSTQQSETKPHVALGLGESNWRAGGSVSVQGKSGTGRYTGPGGGWDWQRLPPPDPITYPGLKSDVGLIESAPEKYLALTQEAPLRRLGYYSGKETDVLKAAYIQHRISGGH